MAPTVRCPLVRRILVVSSIAVILGIGCGDDDGPAELDVPDPWNCDEFVDGADLSVDRFNHETVVLDDERVLLIAGHEDDDGAAVRTDTWEVFNVADDSVEVEATEFEQPRRNTSTARLPSDNIMVVGGEDASGDGLTSTKIFDIENLEWIPGPDMNLPYPEAIELDDGRVLALGLRHGTSQDPVEIRGQIFDPDDFDWHSAPTADLPHNQVGDFTADRVYGGDIAVAYGHVAPAADQIPDAELPDGVDVTVYESAAVKYDYDDGTVDTLAEFDHQGVGFEFDFVELPYMRKSLLQIDTREYDEEEFEEIEAETLAKLYDPGSESFDEHDTYDSSPGTVVEVVPRDKLIYVDSAPVEIHDVDEQSWVNFVQIPDGIYYTSMDLLADDRLFVSGERSASGHDRRGVTAGYCEPASDD